MSHRNWFLTIVEKYIISIVWLAIFISAILVATTYLIAPVYYAKTELTLDASLEKIIPNMMAGMPSATANDYIRAEYFAINSVYLMQQPHIGAKIIIDNGLVDSNGDKIDVSDFINPSQFSLMFSTNGQGVTVQWISDTQQFSITGYGKDIQSAAALASQYTDAVIAYDENQFRNILENLLERRKISLTTAADMRSAVEREQDALRIKYGVADWSGRIASLTVSLASVEQDIIEEEMAGSTDTERLTELQKELEALRIPVHLAETEKKSDILETLKSSLADLTQQLAALSVEVTPNHPRYLKLEKEIDSVHQQMAQQTKREYLQNTSSTSDVLDVILGKIMQTREDRVVRSIRLAQLKATKKQYIEELTFLGNGQVAHNNLQEQQERLTSMIQVATQDIIEIGSVIEKPFSFFRRTSEPFIDLDNINNAKYLPKRKWTLVISFLGVFFLGLFYVIIKELHLETLFYAWQLPLLPETVEWMDVVYGKNKKSNAVSIRHLFKPQKETGGLVRIRRVDSKSDPHYIAMLGADYSINRGESILMVNNIEEPVKKGGTTHKGLHSWLVGNIQNPIAEIQHKSEGYDILCDNQWNLTSPWVRTMPEIKELFFTLLKHYNKVILLDPSIQDWQPLSGDVLDPDVDILTVKGGELSVSQTYEFIQREQQKTTSNRTILLVMNDKVSINLFSINGCLKLVGRFIIYPFEWLRNKKI